MIRKLGMLNNKVHDIEAGDLMNRKNMGNTSKPEDKYRFLGCTMFDGFKTHIVNLIFMILKKLWIMNMN